MTASVIGRVKSEKGKTYEAKWDQSSRNVYVPTPDGLMLAKHLPLMVKSKVEASWEWGLI